MYLLAHGTSHISSNRRRILCLRNHITTKLQDNQSCISLTVESGELSAVDLSEDIARASTHRDIVHDNAPVRLETNAIDFSLPLEE